MPEQPRAERPIALLLVLAAFFALTLGALVAGPSLRGPVIPPKPKPQPGAPEVRRRVQTVQGDLRLTMDLPGDVWVFGEPRRVVVTLDNVSNEATSFAAPEGAAVSVRVFLGPKRIVFDSDPGRESVPEVRTSLAPGRSVTETFAVTIPRRGSGQLRIQASGGPDGMGIQVPPIPIEVAPR